MAQTRNLLLLCACLSRETTRRAVGLLAGEIHSPDLDWEGIISIAGRHLLLPAMRNALVNKRLVSALPTVVRNFLDEAYRLNTARNQRLKAQSSEIVRSLSRAEITSVLLKGGAFLFDCKYEDLGMRMMLDLDILVPEDRFEESVAVLRHLGYERCGDSHLQVTDPQHYPALFRPGEIATVELHRRLEEQEHLLPPGLVFDHSDTLKDGNSYVCIPSSTHRIMHNISHAAIDHGEYLSWSISLKALYDLMMISEAHPTTVNWEDIKGAMRRCGYIRVFEAYIYLASHLLKWPAPPAVLPTWHAALHYRRCLAAEAGLRSVTRRITTRWQRDILKRLLNPSSLSSLPWR
jgi:hypothetical protein